MTEQIMCVRTRAQTHTHTHTHSMFVVEGLENILRKKKNPNNQNAGSLVYLLLDPLCVFFSA